MPQQTLIWNGADCNQQGACTSTGQADMELWQHEQSLTTKTRNHIALTCRILLRSSQNDMEDINQIDISERPFSCSKQVCNALNAGPHAANSGQDQALKHLQPKKQQTSWQAESVFAQSCHSWQNNYQPEHV